MQTGPVIDKLLQSACPSIRYRLRAEILGQCATDQTMLTLQDQIRQDALVQMVSNWQQPDGWLGWDFHGAKSLETGVRILCEKGVSRQTPLLARALQALKQYPDRMERGIGKPGRLLDELGFGGALMIKAVVHAYAGNEAERFVKQQISEALAGFNAVLDVDSVEDITEKLRGKLVFLPGVRWPGIYHLRLLAFTQSWRTKANQTMLVNAVKRLVALSPLPDIYVRNRSQWIAPASFCMHEFDPDMQSMLAADWMMWFHRMECLARLGVIKSISALERQVDCLAGCPGWFTKTLHHAYFSKWGAYTGLMLEPNWLNPKRRWYDLTFRRLLILHYYES